MTETKIAKSWGKGCIRQVLWVILLFLIMLGAFILFVLASTILPLTQYQRVLLWIGGSLVFLSLLIAGVLIWNNRLIHRRAGQLDEAFAPLGLVGKAYLWNGRQYHGIMNGRHVDIYFYRGPSLELYVSAAINTRMGIGLKSAISRMACTAINSPELSVADRELTQLSFYPIDENWGRALVAIPEAKSSILRLTTAVSSLEFRNLLFQPEANHLKIHRINLDGFSGEKSRALCNDLIALAGIAESIPAPKVTSVATSMERRARLSRNDFTLPLVGLTCGLLGFFTAIFIFVLILFFNLSKGGF